jgi:hypothetical protein
MKEWKMDPEGEPCQADGANIVIKTKRPRSEGQMLSLSKAQAARKEKSAARREKVAADRETSVTHVTPESSEAYSPKKDYKTLYKLQKQSLAELRFEKAVNDKLIETIRAREEKPTPAPEPKETAAAVSVRGGWLTSGPIQRKKNPMHHW